MPTTSYLLKKITHLRILLSSNEQIGTGRHEGLEVIPYTEFIKKQLAPNVASPPIPPPGIVAEEFLHDLRPYQQDDLRQLIMRKSSANFSEPRTGKTPTALRLFKAKGLTKFIIVVPASALYQWKSEVLKWYGQKAEVLSSGLSPKRQQEIIKGWGTAHVALIVSYDSLKLVMRNGHETGLLPMIRKQKEITGIIVDEGHRIRNHKTAQAKAIFSLKDIPNKHVLTGTPAHGHTKDVFSILHFLYPTIFTGYWRFINYYFYTVEKRNYARQTKYTDIEDLRNEYELPEFISHISVQHKQIEVMPWLETKNRINIPLPATKEQKKYIKELEDDFETEHIIVDGILTQLIRIRQIADSPELLGLKGSSPKIDWLKTYIADYPERSIIIFSNFTQFLHLVARDIDCPYLIVGATSSKRREELRLMFQEGKIKILLINIQAGKEALTLDRAETAIFLDIYPPYGDIEQAENRFTSTTNTGKVKLSDIVSLIIEDTYDETLFKLVRRRASETEILNDYKKHLGKEVKP